MSLETKNTQNYEHRRRGLMSLFICNKAVCEAAYAPMIYTLSCLFSVPRLYICCCFLSFIRSVFVEVCFGDIMLCPFEFISVLEVINIVTRERVESAHLHISVMCVLKYYNVQEGPYRIWGGWRPRSNVQWRSLIWDVVFGIHDNDPLWFTYRNIVYHTFLQIKMGWTSSNCADNTDWC